MNRRDALLLIVASTFAWPVALSAQLRGRVWRVAFLSLVPISAEYVDGFRKSMRDLGYEEGRNLVIEWRIADGNFERMAPFAEELVRAKVDVIVAWASPAISAAQKATSTIPIVMATTGDPVGSGFVMSLARPGGNVTGLSNLGGETGAKHVELLAEVVPRLSRLGVLVTPTSSTYGAIVESVRAGARAAGITTIVAEASTASDIDAAFALLAREKVDCVLVGAAPLFAGQRRRIAELALAYRLPSMFGNRAYVEAGGLMSYGYRQSEQYRQVAVYVDKILKGANPGDLPVEQPRALELVFNQKTARDLAITIPKDMRLRASEVIE
jgi:ABC-type uncharacterized transport system substrate-binding protein